MKIVTIRMSVIVTCVNCDVVAYVQTRNLSATLISKAKAK